MSLFLLVSDSHSSWRVTFGKSKQLCALILSSQNWNQRVHLIYPVINMLDNIWKRSRRTCRQPLQERLVLDGHNHTIYIPNFTAAVSVLWQLLPATFPASHRNLVWMMPSYRFFSVFSHNTKTFHFLLFQQIWKTSFSHSVSGIGMAVPQHNVVLRQVVQRCRCEGYSFLQAVAELASSPVSLETGLPLHSLPACLSKCYHWHLNALPQHLVNSNELITTAALQRKTLEKKYISKT